LNIGGLLTEDPSAKSTLNSDIIANKLVGFNSVKVQEERGGEGG